MSAEFIICTKHGQSVNLYLFHYYEQSAHSVWQETSACAETALCVDK